MKHATEHPVEPKGLFERLAPADGGPIGRVPEKEVALRKGRRTNLSSSGTRRGSRRGSTERSRPTPRATSSSLRREERGGGTRRGKEESRGRGEDLRFSTHPQQAFHQRPFRRLPNHSFPPFARVSAAPTVVEGPVGIEEESVEDFGAGLPRLPQVSAGEEARDSVAGEVV